MKKTAFIFHLSSFIFLLLALSAPARSVTGQSWSTASGPAKRMSLEFFQGESIEYTQPFRSFTPDTNTTYVWEIRGWDDYTNVYAVTTGTVASVTDGELYFELTGAEANIEDGTYLGFVKAIHTNDTRDVLASQRIKFEWSEWSLSYSVVAPTARPYYTKTEADAIAAALQAQITTNSADIVDLQNVDAASLPRLTQLESQTNLIQSAVQPGDADYTNALALAGSAIQTETDPLWVATANATENRFQGLENATNTLTSDLGSLTSDFQALETNVYTIAQTDALLDGKAGTNDMTTAQADIAALVSDFGPRLVESSTGKMMTVLTAASGWDSVNHVWTQSTTTYGGSYVHADRRDIGILDLGYSLPCATYTNTTTWLIGAGTATNLYDFSPSKSDAAIVENPAIILSGASTEYITLPASDALSLGMLPLDRPDSGHVNSHQGVIVSDDYIYTIQSDILYKRERTAPYAVVDSNTDPYPLIPTVDHFGDGCLLNGKLYIALEHYSSDVDYSDMQIAVYDPDTLLLEASYDITAQAFEISGIGTDGTNLYCVSFVDETGVWKYTPTGTFIEKITLSKTFESQQGVTIRGDEMFISSKYQGIRVYDLDGTYKRHSIFYNAGKAQYFEGLDFTSDIFCVIVEDNTTNHIRFYQEDQLYVNGFCVKMWINLNATSTAERPMIASYDYDSNGRQYYLKAQYGYFVFLVGSGAAASADARTFQATGWVEVTGKYRTDTDRVYVDKGKTVASSAVASSFYYRVHDQPVGVGHIPGTPSTARLDASVCDVRGFTLVNNVEVANYRYPLQEKAGDIAYDVGPWNNNGTKTSADLAAMNAGTQNVSAPFAEYGGLTFTNGIDTIYVPNLSDGSGPATNAITGYAISLTNLVDVAHNGGPHSLSNSTLGLVTYDDLITNSVYNATVSDGMVEEFYK